MCIRYWAAAWPTITICGCDVAVAIQRCDTMRSFSFVHLIPISNSIIVPVDTMMVIIITTAGMRRCRCYPVSHRNQWFHIAVLLCYSNSPTKYQCKYVSSFDARFALCRLQGQPYTAEKRRLHILGSNRVGREKLHSHGAHYMLTHAHARNLSLRQDILDTKTSSR